MEAATIKFLHLVALIFYVLLLPSAGSTAPDTLNNGGNITDGETLVSAGGSFTLGFFSPADDVLSNRYLGIWYSGSLRPRTLSAGWPTVTAHSATRPACW